VCLYEAYTSANQACAGLLCLTFGMVSTRGCYTGIAFNVAWEVEENRNVLQLDGPRQLRVCAAVILGETSV
jgi:hypothetical protein